VTAADPPGRHLLRARDLADRAYATPIDVGALARAAHASPAHFSRQFSAAFGVPPGRYLQQRRLARAALLLQETRVPVTEVALMVGFRSLGTFCRQFHREFGVPARAYRLASEPSMVPSCFRSQPARAAGSEKPAAA
jgi:AraC-like DNA-binding protein